MARNRMVRNTLMGKWTHRIILALSLGAAPLIMSPAFAGWQEQASPPDIDRLVQLPSIRARAIHAAESWPGRGDFNALRAVLEPEARTVPARAMLGNWRCRQMKLGRMTSYMVYDGWFACNIRPYNGGVLVQKMNGSQRFVGFLFPENGAWVYLGASSARGEPYHNYSGRSPALC